MNLLLARTKKTVGSTNYLQGLDNTARKLTMYVIKDLHNSTFAGYSPSGELQWTAYNQTGPALLFPCLETAFNMTKQIGAVCVVCLTQTYIVDV